MGDRALPLLASRARGVKVKRTRFRRIVLKQLRKMRWHLGLAGVCTVSFTLTELLAPWPLKIIFDHILLNKPLPGSLAFLGGVVSGDKMTAVLIISLLILVTAILRGFSLYGQIFLTSRSGYQMVNVLRRRLFVHLQKLSLAYHDRMRSGELLTRISADTNTLRDVFGDSVLTFIAQVLTIVGMIAVMLVLNWQLSLIVLVALPILGTALQYLFRKVKVSASRQRKKEGEIASRISESLSMITLVQAFGRERYENDRFSADSARVLEESVRTARLEAAASRTVEIVGAVGLWAVVVVGSLQALQGTILPGEVLVFVTYVTNMYKPLRNLAKISTKFSKAVVSVERIAQILNTEPDIEDDPTALSATGLQGAITFEHVSFGYGAGKGVLEDISFTIPVGQHVALVGASGAGKSTIASLLLRFYDPQAGSIAIDGVDIRRYQRESLREQIGVVLQDTVLFGASIRDNIAYGDPDATQETVEEAARRAAAHGFITALPDGYETILSERGTTLSGGQRQRICLARALIKQPAILILDEPTAAVDAEATAQIEETISRVQAGRTTLVIAHHFSALDRFDQILVLRDGRVVERGTHDELLAHRGYYYDLGRLQGFAVSARIAGSVPGGSEDNAYGFPTS